MRTLLHFFYYLLYHPFAFTYDLVAATVSLGRWQDWVLSVVPFIEGERVLEIGHGPGHLQRVLLSRGLIAVGIDESAPMGRLAQKNLKRVFARSPAHFSSDDQLQNNREINLARSLAQALPFPGECFDTLVATFPAKYIFEVITLDEAFRVLHPGGRFVILPGASILGRSLMDRMMALIFRITGETPPNIAETLQERSRGSFSQTKFIVQMHELDIKSSRVFIMVATKPASGIYEKG